MRWALLVATVPIAITANTIRVAITGLLSEVNTKLAQGAYHEMEGYIVFIVAFVALLVTHRVISWSAKKFGRLDLMTGVLGSKSSRVLTVVLLTQAGSFLWFIAQEKDSASQAATGIFIGRQRLGGAAER